MKSIEITKTTGERELIFGSAIAHISAVDVCKNNTKIISIILKDGSVVSIGNATPSLYNAIKEYLLYGKSPCLQIEESDIKS